MQINFTKYQGTGNDFIIIDNRQLFFPKDDTNLVAQLCDRRFGIGGDGLILLENDATSDFKMVYYNSDGNQSTMCGNGGRCLVAFAKRIAVIEKSATFMAVDGLHYAAISDDGIVSLQMQNVTAINSQPEYVFLNTGSPHHIQFENKLQDLDVNKAGSTIRYSDLYGKEGSNVNFVAQEATDFFAIRTYERGVEGETLSCGTGATATAIAMHYLGKTTANSVGIKVQGGQLEVTFQEADGIYSEVFLKGPAVFVFEGIITI